MMISDIGLLFWPTYSKPLPKKTVNHSLHCMS